MDRLLCYVLTAMVTVMLVAVVCQVVTRYVLKTTLIGPEEIARYMMIGSTFMAIPVLARRRDHIAVDALAYYLPRGVVQVILSRGILLFETAFLSVFAYYAFGLLREVHASGQYSTGLEIPLTWPFSTLFIGTALGALMTGAMAIQAFSNGGVRGKTVEEVLAEQTGESGDRK